MWRTKFNLSSYDLKIFSSEFSFVLILLMCGCFGDCIIRHWRQSNYWRNMTQHHSRYSEHRCDWDFLFQVCYSSFVINKIILPHCSRLYKVVRCAFAVFVAFTLLIFVLTVLLYKLHVVVFRFPTMTRVICEIMQVHWERINMLVTGFPAWLLLFCARVKFVVLVGPWTKIPICSPHTCNVSPLPLHPPEKIYR